MFDCKRIVLYRKVNLRELKILQREEQKQGMLLMAKIRRQWDAQEQRFEQELQVNCVSLRSLAFHYSRLIWVAIISLIGFKLYLVSGPKPSKPLITFLTKVYKGPEGR